MRTGPEEGVVSDRPDAANGKYSLEWGTLKACRACGQCQCFACHPNGPCVDDREAGQHTPGEGRTGLRERWAT
jgi:hypothetical protein